MESKWYYLDWSRPFSIEFAGRLKAGHGKSASYDHLLIWTASARAGRHVLNELFNDTGGGTEAFHPPELMTPARYVRSLLHGHERIATTSQCLFAWKQVLEGADPAMLKPVFPVVPRDNKSAWAYTVAEQLMRLRERLAEDQWSYRKVAARKLSHDPTRWARLADLELAYLEQLENRGLVDPDHKLDDILAEPLPQPSHKVLMVAGVLNMSTRQAACLRALQAAGLAVEFYLPVPESFRTSFDDRGRPKNGFWEKEPLPESIIEACVQRASEPRELVDRILDLSEAYGNEVDSLVVSSPERDLADYLIEKSRLTRTPYYAPEGCPLSATGWGRLIALLDDWQRSGSLATLFDLFNHHLFRQWALSQGIEVKRVQNAVQTLLKKKLLKHARQLVDGALGPSASIGMVREALDQLDQSGFSPPGEDDFAGNLWRLLSRVAMCQPLDAESIHALRQLEELLQDLRTGFQSLGLSGADWWALLNYELSNAQFYPERSETERPVSGWLELPWESAPHIVLLSLPDSQVPGPKALDSFLTPMLCRTLGLYGPDELAAFHAFRLRLILESRKEWGRVDILLPDRGLDDSPLLPSRFLFMAEDTDILSRVETLLGEKAGEEVPLPASFGTTVQPPPVPELTQISVTALRAYLQNPFQFYLERLHRFSVPEALPREMDAMAFGHLAHAVLEALNSTEAGLSLIKEKDIAGFLLESLDTGVRARFGSRIPVSLRIQVSSLSERFRAAAGSLAQQRREGWVPERTEWAFHEDLEFGIDGVRLRGVVDLLERNTETGEYRIIDYKTSDKAADPAKVHLSRTNSRSREPVLPECDFTDGNKSFRWNDLQLPLYQKAVELHTGKIPGCAYFNLSKAVGEIGLIEWNPTLAQRETAMVCAEAIVRQIKAGRFPPGGNSSYEDNWISWFGGDYEINLDADWMARYGGTGA